MSFANSKTTSPSKTLHYCENTHRNTCKQTQDSKLNLIKKTVDYQSEITKQTKTTECPPHFQEYNDRLDLKKLTNVRGIESYHYDNQLLQQSQTVQRSFFHSKSKLFPFLRQSNQQYLSKNNRCDGDFLLKTGLKNTQIRQVESEFKSQDKSQLKYRQTPNKKIVFHDRDTIVSKYKDS